MLYVCLDWSICCYLLLYDGYMRCMMLVWELMGDMIIFDGYIVQ